MKCWIYIFAVLVFMLISCQSNSLEDALIQSKENRYELEKVLAYYEKDVNKYRAACFLIKNMPGHFRYDSLSLKRLQSYYDTCCLISEKYHWKKSDEWRDETNAYWKNVKNKALYPPLSYNMDVQTLSADCLIKEIDLAFKAWQENRYTCNTSFDNFCKYILPYRISNYLYEDDVRSIFYFLHKGWFSDTKEELKVKIDMIIRKSTTNKIICNRKMIKGGNSYFCAQHYKEF